MKPTWDILEFNDDIEDIPCFSRGRRKQNPLDRNVAIHFQPASCENVYYLSKTGKTIVTERALFSEER